MTTDITELAQREKFEAWFKSSFHPDKTGPYIKDQLYFAWKAAGAELVEALEKAQRANGYLREQSAEWERKAISNFEDCAEMSARVEELESQRKLAFTASNRWADKFREAEKRIAELESRTVKLPHRNLGHPKLFLLCPFPYYDAEDMEKALAAAGIKVEAE
ncbi:hypothetical protein BME69_08575 [Klebsiella quasipneumoniae subsp. quasipneumoniae]|uniref:hypothetical protein n=1 Tax=Klebsiella quasipneumoniae TaxID=1463165 RepID=UPI000B408670|nr:hypothetical protein [Klebsiella quasipneumoniae]OVY38281.1 hypothetical protein BME69_08575 [Klebsiella quasipneumoniae subsp. quasipneumoniae]